MPRFTAGSRLDDNQPELVRQLRAIGASVTSTAGVGDGFPDICVGWRGQNYLLEIKDPKKIPSRRKLTPDEKEWHDRWGGQVAVVETFEDCLQVLGVTRPA